MRRLAFPFFACLLAIAISAQAQTSQQTTVTPEVTNTQPQPQQMAPPPITVNVLPVPKSKEEAEEERKDRMEKAESDRKLVDLTGELAKFTRWLAYATIGLVAVTAGLVIMGIKQARDMGVSLQIADTSAQAALKSAKVAEIALDTIERPYVFIDRHIAMAPDFTTLLNSRLLGSTFDPAVSYFIFNHGRTPAILQSIASKLVVLQAALDESALPGPIEPHPSEQAEAGAIGSLQKEGPFRANLGRAIERGAIDMLAGQQAYFFFHGAVRFYDPLGREQLVGFGLRYRSGEERWAPFGGERFNYHRFV